MIDLKLSRKLGSAIISPSISDNGTICIYGKNGSGKTSTLLMICGFLPPDSGYVTINGRDVTSLQPQKRSAVFINQDTYFPDMDVDEHLVRFVAKRSIRASNDNIAEILDIMGINFGGRMKNLSLGQKIRVSIGTALISRPEVLVIDEALSNLDDKDHVLENLNDYARRYRIDMIFVTQDKDDSKLSDHLYHMGMGTSERIF
ncbi:MAG: ATP-binding cassette domain-containing protein [Thermoplasmataceae archaeon]